MTFLFEAWEVKYLYFTCLLFSFSEGSTEQKCTFHTKYCFFVEHIRTPISTVADLDELCRIRPNAWPLEIYDDKLQKSLDKYLSSLDQSYSLKTVFLNVERSQEGWQYVQDYDSSATVDLKDIPPNADAAFYDIFADKIETTWMNYQRPYACSYKLSSSQCNRTDSLVTSDLCFTRHERQLKWVQAINDCRSRYGYLALMKYHHQGKLRLWLESSSHPNLKQWWIGVAWRPLKWRKKGTIVTWWNFSPDISFTMTPHEVHFQIKDDNNQWKVQKNFNSSDLVICMTEHPDVCTGKECQSESKMKIPVVEISVVIVVVVVAIVAIVVAIRLWLRKKKRREISKRTEEAGPFKTVPDPIIKIPNPDPCPGSKHPIYLQPLPDIYEKTYHTIEDNQYEKLMA